MSNVYQKERFISSVRDELAHFLDQELEKDPDVFVSIMEIKPRPSFGSARVLVSVWPSDKKVAIEKRLKVLEHRAKSYLVKRFPRKQAISVVFEVIA